MAKRTETTIAAGSVRAGDTLYVPGLSQWWTVTAVTRVLGTQVRIKTRARIIEVPRTQLVTVLR